MAYETFDNRKGRIKRFCFILLMVIIITPHPKGKILSAAENVVKKINSVELDRLMNDPDCKCLIVAMAAWCDPCREELPVLNKLYEKYKDQGLQVVGISLDLEGPEAIQPIIEKKKVVFPVYWVGENAINKYKIEAIPLLFFINRGEIVEKISGKRSEKFLDSKIQELLHCRP